MTLSPQVTAQLVVAGVVAVLVSTALLRLACYLVREDVPGWAAALGMKIGALFVGMIFSGFLYAMAASASHNHKVRPDAVIALNLFSVLANVLLNAGVYRVTMPWLSYAKSMLVVVMEVAMGLIIGAVIVVTFIVAATSFGWYSADELQEMFQVTPPAESRPQPPKPEA